MLVAGAIDVSEIFGHVASVFTAVKIGLFKVPSSPFV